MLLLRKQLSWKQVHTEKKMMQNSEIACFNPGDVSWATVYSKGKFFCLHLEIVNFLNDDLTINTSFCE